MRRSMFAAVLLTISVPALADSYRFDRQVVTDGDSSAKLAGAAGRPDQVTPIENTFGARTGETWVYYIDGKTVSFTIDSDGRITRITEVY